MYQMPKSAGETCGWAGSPRRSSLPRQDGHRRARPGERGFGLWGGGPMVVLLVWVYYCVLILFFGAEFTQAWPRGTARSPQPPSLGGTDQKRVHRPLPGPERSVSPLGDTPSASAAPDGHAPCPLIIRRAATAIKPWASLFSLVTTNALPTPAIKATTVPCKAARDHGGAC
jgi:hypothetical protein